MYENIQLNLKLFGQPIQTMKPNTEAKLILNLGHFTLQNAFMATESMKLTEPRSRISLWVFVFKCTEEEEVAMFSSAGFSFWPQDTACMWEEKVTRGSCWRGRAKVLIWQQLKFWWYLLMLGIAFKIINSDPGISHVLCVPSTFHQAFTKPICVCTCLISVKTCSEFAK